MRALWTLALLLSSATTLSTSSSVLRLQEDDFHAHLNAHSPVLVDFCVPSYEPCQKFKPEFETAADVLKKRDITCISIDCSVEAKLCSNHSIASYPAIRVFRGPTNFTRYRHERKAANIISYMIRQSLPLVSEVTKTNFKEIISMGAAALIAYVDQNDQASRGVFTSFAESHQNEFITGISSNVELAKLDTSHTPFIILYNPLDQINPLFEEEFEVARIEDFTKRYSTPLIGTFSLETYYAYTENGTPLAHIFVRTDEERSALVALLKNTAEKFKGKLNFATIDATKYGFFAKVLNLVPDRFPALVIEDLVTGDTAPFDQSEEITAEKIESFVEKYFEDRLNLQETPEPPSRDEL